MNVLLPHHHQPHPNDSQNAMKYDDAVPHVQNRAREIADSNQPLNEKVNAAKSTAIDIIDDVEHHGGRARAMMLDSLKGDAVGALFDALYPDPDDADMHKKDTGIRGIFVDEDTPHPHHDRWLEMWLRFRTATVFGQEYVIGKPAVRYHRDDGLVELGIMHATSRLNEYERDEYGDDPDVSYDGKWLDFAGLIDPLPVDEAREQIEQCRASHRDDPNTHARMDTMSDAWERVLDSIEHDQP